MSDFEKRLRAAAFGTNTKPVAAVASVPFVPSFGTPGTTVLDTIKESSILSRVFQIFASIFVLLFVILLYHFFVNPILPDWVTGTTIIPGMNDELLYWTKPDDVKEVRQETSIGEKTSGYTVMMDLQIDDATQKVGEPRILLHRGKAEQILSRTALRQ